MLALSSRSNPSSDTCSAERNPCCTSSLIGAPFSIKMNVLRSNTDLESFKALYEFHATHNFNNNANEILNGNSALTRIEPTVMKVVPSDVQVGHKNLQVINEIILLPQNESIVTLDDETYCMPFKKRGPAVSQNDGTYNKDILKQTKAADNAYAKFQWGKYWKTALDELSISEK